jgi:hypothetical protein
MRELTIDAIEAGVSSDQRRTRILQSPVFSFKNALRLAMQEGERIERSRPVKKYWSRVGLRSGGW